VAAVDGAHAQQVVQRDRPDGFLPQLAFDHNLDACTISNSRFSLDSDRICKFCTELVFFICLGKAQADASAKYNILVLVTPT
jgi:hypothetical protein